MKKAQGTLPEEGTVGLERAKRDAADGRDRATIKTRHVLNFFFEVYELPNNIMELSQSHLFSNSHQHG